MTEYLAQIGKAGGNASAASLTAEERKARAKKAVGTRWAKRNGAKPLERKK